MLKQTKRFDFLTALVKLAVVDDYYSPEENEVLLKIAESFGVSVEQFEAIKS